MLNIGGEQVLTIDSDAHVIETEETWLYLEPAEQKYRPRLVGSPDNEREQYWVLEDKVIGFRFPNLTAAELETLSKQVGRELTTPADSRDMSRVDRRLEHMDQIGLDVQVLHNTLWITRLTDRIAAEVALCRSYNRWLGDIWAHANGRLRWTCMPPTLSMADALDEVRWCKQHGAAGICMRPLEGERTMLDPYFYPLYEEAQRLDMPIAVHIANGNPGNVDLVRVSRSWQFRLPTLGGCIAYLQSEIAELFPRLRVGFIEAGAQWLPWVLNLAVNGNVPKLRGFPPAELLRTQRVWVTCENRDDVAYVSRIAGEDNLLIGTDYGHTDPSSNIHALNEFAATPNLSDTAKKKIVRDNALEFYGIAEAELPGHAKQTAGTVAAGVPA
ncbi:MAG TPA: amidohydrolase family protein [Chloroflexota bacterium]|nr:amidohydrolase family protein [Chloroflexota bacterium]